MAKWRYKWESPILRINVSVLLPRIMRRQFCLEFKMWFGHQGSVKTDKLLVSRSMITLRIRERNLYLIYKKLETLLRILIIKMCLLNDI